MAPSSISSVPSDIHSSLSQLLLKLDSYTARLSAILSTPTGIDKFMLTIYYTIKLVLPQIKRVRLARAKAQLSSFAAKASPALLPGETLVAVTSLSRTDRALAATETGAAALSGIVSEFRMVGRLWGLMTMYRWGRATALNPPGGKLDTAIVAGQVFACTMYQVLENVAFLAGKGVISGEWVRPEKLGRMWLLSCRFWFAHTVLEAWRLLREKSRLDKKIDAAVSGEKEDKIAVKKEVQAWNRAWYSNAAYAPMALHWSFATGLIPDEVVGALGLVVSYNTFGHMWRSSA